MFVVRYTADTRSFLAPHTDDADISFNILLSQAFQGGGTRFWNRVTDKPFATVQPTRVGSGLVHSATVRHEGLPVISDGVRHILVGFLSIDAVQPHTGLATGLSWFASWWSMAFVHVKFKAGYFASRQRRKKQVQAQQKWTDSKWMQSLLTDILLLAEHVGDIVGTHRHYNLVQEKDAAFFLKTLHGAGARTGATWFAGQQIYLDFDGSFSSEWATRRGREDEFKDL